MHISTQTIIQKMQKELQELHRKQNTTEMEEHMVNIRLLTDLWLEEFRQTKKDMHQTLPSNNLQEISTPVIEPDDDGTSIFDF